MVNRSILAHIAPFLKLRAGVAEGATAHSHFCDACEHLFYTPMLTPAQLAQLYDGYRGEDYTQQRISVEGSYAAIAALFMSRDTAHYDERRAFYAKHFRSRADLTGRVVDFGGGEGYFARFAFPNAEVTVVEESFERDGGDLASLLAGAQVLFCAHVLEHLPRPYEHLVAMTRVLEPGALVYIETPHEHAGELADDFAAIERHYLGGGRMIHTALNVLHEHVAIFSARSIEALMRRCHVTPVERYSNAQIIGILGVRDGPAAQRPVAARAPAESR